MLMAVLLGFLAAEKDKFTLPFIIRWHEKRNNGEKERTYPNLSRLIKIKKRPSTFILETLTVSY
jgi:hypothetical protein